MALLNSRNFILLATLLLASFHSQSSRLHVEGMSLEARDAPTTVEPDIKELTTQSPESSTSYAKADALTKAADSLTHPTTTAESITEGTTTVTGLNNHINLETERFMPSKNSNRSLYDELKSVASFPTTFSSFETSSEFVKFDNMKMNDDSEENDEESLEKKFMEDEMGFKNNETKEERHTIDEAVFDGESIKYSSMIMKITNGTEEVEKVEVTSAIPTTGKKGKYLGLMPQGNDNINASIPNNAEVWALAGMREFESKPTEKAASINVDLLKEGSALNETAKNLLDWTEIAKMNNETDALDDSLNDLPKTTVLNDIGGDDDPATSENKQSGTFVASQSPATTMSTLLRTLMKGVVEDNRIEQDLGNMEFSGSNKTNSPTSRVDADAFSKKTPEEREDSAVELIDPSKNIDPKQTKEKLRVDEMEVFSTTEPGDGFTTESGEIAETTTTEASETTTSIVDSFTIIGEDEDSDDVYKRTITELPVETTAQPLQTTSRLQTTTVMSDKHQVETTTNLPSTAFNEIPRSTQRYKSTKSLRIATTTEAPVETTGAETEVPSSPSTPKFLSSSPTIATTQLYEFEVDSSSSPTVEIFDDDKFKYSTLLPETTTLRMRAKSVDFEESNPKAEETLNKESLDGEPMSNSNIGIISASVSVVVILIIAIAAYFVWRRRNQQKFSQRCRPVGLDAYSLDNVSVYNSVRRKANALRLSKRSYGNSAFEDPSLQSNVLDYQSIQDFAKKKTSIQDEFKEIPQVSVRVDEMPENCEDKNRYANVVPLPETRVHLQRLNDEEKSEYINANFVKGPKDSTNYYIATQAPLENTTGDFWRMIWEQNSKVIIMATDLTENGVERCAEYIPASVVLDNSQSYGDFQVTLKSREVKGKYAVSQLHVKNLKTNTWREIMHLWYSWPENGCPTDETSFINLLLDARSYLRTNLPEQLDENSNAERNGDMNDKEKLSTLDKTKSLQRVQGPLTVHCSPGTGRTGTLIACDIVLRMLETPPRQIDIPQIVYTVRRGRANAVRTRDQYEFIYHIANIYATKLTNAPTES